MITLLPPDAKVSAVFDDCLAGMQNGNQKTRISGTRQNVLNSSASFRLSAVSLNKLGVAHPSFSSQLKSDMMWFYNNRFVKSKEGRKVYDKILSLSAGLCPFCGIARAYTLDHCLPKSEFPFLAVTPDNLSAACRDCNTEKGPGVTSGNLSPYFDSWASSQSWLEAKVVDTSQPEQLSYSVRSVGSWTTGQQQSVNQFFKDSKLDERYFPLAINEFNCSKVRFGDAFRRGGIDEVQRVLGSQYIGDARVRLNGWRTAANRAWLQASAAIRW